MLNLAIQCLILLSGMLVNFFIPMLFGLEKYGLFIKANILVFFFHKLMDIVSEPLISNIEKKLCFSVSITFVLFVLVCFSICNYFVEAGSILLLGSMLYSNSILLVMYRNLLSVWIVLYLAFFNLLFLVLLSFDHFNIISLSITDTLTYTNLIPASIWLIFLVISKKIDFVFDGIYNNLIRLARVFPSLFSLTLVSNVFANILPFYLSFIFPPEMLGLLRVQTSIVQSVSAIFPINTKVISAYFVEGKRGIQFIEQITKFSMNYFYLVACLGFLILYVYKGNSELSLVVFLMPIIHLSLILERCLLGMKKRRSLIFFNILVASFSCIAIAYVQTIADMMLLYAAGISLYILLMLNILSFEVKRIVKSVALMTPIAVYLAAKSNYSGGLILLVSTLFVFTLAPVNKKMFSILRLKL